MGAILETAVIVLNWNGWADTERCLHSLLRLDADDYSIIVCDNASSDGSPERLRRWIVGSLPSLNAQRQGCGRQPIEVTLLETGGNLGYAGGNNVGLRHALARGFAHFWILNNDCEPAPDALDWLRRRVAEDGRIGLCGATLVYADGDGRVQTRGGGRFSRLKGRGSAIGGMGRVDARVERAAIEREMGYVSGASVLVTRAFLQAVGPMSEDYFLYWEELDWWVRARGRFRLGYAPQAIVRHRVGASIGTSDHGEGSALSTYYLTRNRVKFCWRHSRVSLPFVYADLGRRVAANVVRGRWERATLLLRAIAGLPFVT